MTNINDLSTLRGFFCGTQTRTKNHGNQENHAQSWLRQMGGSPDSLGHKTARKIMVIKKIKHNHG
jgi:hypothetical protein